MDRFGEGLRMVGGINAPKRIECIGSDGKRYPQLVKDRDDLRQDASLEQVRLESESVCLSVCLSVSVCLHVYLSV